MVKIGVGDVVFHRGTRETWVVLWTDGKYLEPAGWPPCRADVAHCFLVDTCQDSARKKELEEAWARRRQKYV